MNYGVNHRKNKAKYAGQDTRKANFASFSKVGYDVVVVFHIDNIEFFISYN